MGEFAVKLSVRRMAASRVFSRVLLFYLVLVLFFGGVCCAAYFWATETNVERLVERNRLVFENSAIGLSNTFSTIESFTETLYNQKELQTLMGSTARGRGNLTIGIYKTIEELPLLSDSSGIIGGYFVYLPAADVIIAPKQGYMGIEKYYDAHFALDPAQPFADWKREVLEGSANSIHASWSHHSEIQYSLPLASRLIGVPNARAVFRLKPDRLLRQLSVSLLDEDGCAMITDAEGTILAVSEGGAEIARVLDGCVPAASARVQTLNLNEKTYLCSAADLTHYGVRMLIFAPRSAVRAEARESIRGILSAFVWTVIGGLVVLLALLALSFRPLWPIAQRVAETDANGHGLKMVSEAFLRMERNNRLLEKRLEEQAGHLRNGCVNRLIHGRAADAYTLEDMLRHAALPIHGSHFAGVAIRLGEEAETEAARAMTLEILERFRDHLVFLTFDSLCVVDCLFFEEEDGETDLNAYFAGVYEGLQTLCGGEPEICVGTRCDRLECVADSFRAARRLLGVSAHDEWLQLAEDNPGEIAISRVLTKDEAQKLENCTATGDLAGVTRLLDEIYNRNFTQNRLTDFQRQYLFCRLIGVLARMPGCETPADALPGDLLHRTEGEFFEWLTARLAEACEEARDRNTQKSQLFADGVRGYIDENYARYDLSLAGLALHFGVTGSYLSTIFKKQMGTTFSAYLEQVRIQHAERLLGERKLTIDEIAARVGYTNSDSFRRAYKRARGISPSQYKENPGEGGAVR